MLIGDLEFGVRWLNVNAPASYARMSARGGEFSQHSKIRDVHDLSAIGKRPLDQDLIR